jgi:flagellar basal body rod protein FlgC
MSLFNVFSIAGSALTAQSARLNTTASNLANADSVTGADGQPYRAKQVVFKATPMGEGGGLGVRVTQVVDSAAPLRMNYDPANPAAERECGRGDGKHDLGLAGLPKQRRSNEYGKESAHQDACHRAVSN